MPAGQEVAEISLKDGEHAEKITINEETPEISAIELVVHTDEADRPMRGTAHRKFHTAAEAITLLQDMQKTQQAGRLAKAREMEKIRVLQDGDVDEPQPSAESLEIVEPPSQQLSVEKPISAPGKATLLFGDDKAFQQLKERIVLYIKSRLEEMETKFHAKMHTVETSIVELQDENEFLRAEMHILKSRLSVIETNQNKFEGRLLVVEEKTNLNDLHIEEMMIALDKKADRSDAVQGMTRKDMSILEDRMLQINETTLLDIEDLTNRSEKISTL